MANAATPKKGIKATKICSLPYAEDEMQSDESTPSAVTLVSL